MLQEEEEDDIEIITEIQDEIIEMKKDRSRVIGNIKWEIKKIKNA